MIKFVDLGAQHEPLQDEIMATIGPMIASGAFIGGAEVEAFESDWAAACGVEHAIGVANGTDALRLALQALGAGPGREVVTVSHSFVATAEAIAHAGATPVFVDVDDRTGTMDPALVERAITSRTAVIIPVHLYGRPAPMDEIVAIGSRHGLPVIEDACQAHGATYRGRPVGSLAAAACFSFYPSKNLGAAGDGGAITTNDGALADRLRLLRDHGSRVKYHHDVLGWNSRLDAIQAAILRIKLSHLAHWNAERRRIADRYRANLADTAGVTLPPADGDDGTSSVYHLFVVRLDDRDTVRKLVEDHGVATALHYPVPIHRQPPFTSGVALPRTDAWTSSLLSLPMYPELPDADVDRACDVLRTAAEAVANARLGRGRVYRSAALVSEHDVHQLAR